MKILKRFAMGICGVATLALLLQLAAPRAVHALVATLVQVTNTTTNPVPVVDQVASQWHQEYCNAGFAIGESESGCFFTVPAGHTFVIQTVSVQIVVDAGLRVATAGITTNNSFTLYMNTPFSGRSPNGVYDISENTQQLTAYAPAGSNVTCLAEVSGNVTQAASALNCTYEGYFLP